jgi:hypothetical protein
MFHDQFDEGLSSKNALQEAIKTLLEHGMKKADLKQILSVLSADMELVETNLRELEAAGVQEVVSTDFIFGGLLHLWSVLADDNLQGYGITIGPAGRALCYCVLNVHLELQRLPAWIEGALAAVCISYEVELNDEEEESALNAITEAVTNAVLVEFKNVAKDARPVRDERDLRILVAEITWEYAADVDLAKLVTEDN